MTTKFPVVTFCGSMRFWDLLLRTAGEMERKGYIVILPLPVPGEIDANTAEMLAVMHERKIDLAQEVWVISDATGYYGDSVRREIAYATATDKPITYLKRDHLAVSLARVDA